MKDRRISIAVFSAFLSIITLLLYNIPFFKYVGANVNPGFNGVLIKIGLVMIMLVLNFFAAHTILFLFRRAGKWILFLTFLLNATCVYFIRSFDVIIDETMIRNVFNTKASEANSFICAEAVFFFLITGVIPGLLVLLPKIDYGYAKSFFKRMGLSLGIILAIALINISNWPWVDKNGTSLGGLLMPWSYTVNTGRHFNHQRQRNKKEILLPDASINDTTKTAVVLVIGESARRDHFSLYGYERETNPLLSKVEGLKVYDAESAGTYTIAGTKAILSYSDDNQLYEILPNYLYRNGADVVWRSNNWGEPPVHIEKFYKLKDIARQTGLSAEYDGTLLAGLPDLIKSSDKDKVLIVLHTTTSHGPSYNKKYPPEFDVYKPVIHTVEMSQCSQEEIFNSYDNTILYTDYLLNEIISSLKGIEGWKTSMIFVSDHGESLGENNLYMHGMPKKIAPKEQFEIPIILWSSDPLQKYKEVEMADQYCIFHSVLDFLNVESPVFNPSKSLYD